MDWTYVDDYRHPTGWQNTAGGTQRALWCCERLEAGQILFFPHMPYELPEADRRWLLGLRLGDATAHKNISYRPRQDLLRGFHGGPVEEQQNLHRIMRDFSAQVTRFLTQILAPYAPHWTLDFASFRSLEEAGRKLSLHKRNDLLHVDAFPSRPTHGGRILRVFTNLNPEVPRVWTTTEPFETLAERFASAAGLPSIAARTARGHRWHRWMGSLGRAVGLRGAERSAYDRCMLRLHDYLKETQHFQDGTPKTRLEFPPFSTWVVFTDAVAHAALSGQYALEQTYIVPVKALLAPQQSPLRVLEALCGEALVG
jgi:3-deoxy-D-manno-oct-2-ulosonic acid (Kdo) hydroxylase